MRDIFILAMLFTLLFGSNPNPNPMGKILKDQVINKRIQFLIRYDCKNANIDITYNNKHTLFTNEMRTDSTEETNCGDTIGFLPISKSKIAVFVTANKCFFVSGVCDLKYKFSKIDFLFKQDKASAEKHVISCDENGMVTKGTSTNDLFKVETIENDDPAPKRLDIIEQSGKENLIQCDIIYLVEYNDFAVIEKGIWILRVHYDDTTPSGLPAPKIIEMQNLIVADPNSNHNLQPTDKTEFKLEDKVRCDGNKLMVSAKESTKEIVYTKLKKTVANEDKDFKKMNGDPFFEYAADSAICKNPNSLIYTIKKADGAEKQSAVGDPQTFSVQCKEIGSGSWKFVVNAGSDNIEVGEDESVELECLQYNCRTCADVPHHGSCLLGTDPCSAAFENLKFTNDYKKCYELKTTTCTSGIVHLNGVIQKLPVTTNVKCDSTRKKFLINETEIEKMNCVASFSANLNIPSAPVPNTILDKEFKDPRNCHNITHGCQCMRNEGKAELEFLAFSNKNGTDWVRIESLIFNGKEGFWEYNRTVKYNEKEQVVFAKLMDNRAVKCILAKAELEKVPNSQSTVVIGVNIALIVIIAAITAPTVIFFVNARIKKREAYKAAKKDKKKDESSGGKKDGEGKKDEKNEEKKNEA